MENQTIAAIATGLGGGVGIIRVSGEKAQEIGQKLCAPWPESVVSHHLYYGKLYDPLWIKEAEKEKNHSEYPIDQVLFCLMKAPRSYTGEDVLEIHAHGGVFHLKRVLQMVLQAGATLAQPGEFTRRAFLAGKLDLTQAEAISALVSAQSLQATRHAQRQLQGEVGQISSELRKQVVHWLGLLEGSLDFPDLEDDHFIAQTAIPELQSVSNRLFLLAQSFSQGGRALQSGLEIAVVGHTNAGKSSLINALCERERVLVDEAPGTTRDVIEVKTIWDGFSVTLLDTAGEREQASYLEREGLRLGQERTKYVDFMILVVDGVVGLTKEDEHILTRFQNRIPYLIVWNKMDQQGYVPPFLERTLPASALCGWGLEKIKNFILQQLVPTLSEQVVVMQERQAALFTKAAEELKHAIQGLMDGNSWDLIASHLRQSSFALGELTGEEVNESVIDTIFANFCIGK